MVVLSGAGRARMGLVRMMMMMMMTMTMRMAMMMTMRRMVVLSGGGRERMGPVRMRGRDPDEANYPNYHHPFLTLSGTGRGGGAIFMLIPWLSLHEDEDIGSDISSDEGQISKGC